MLNDKIPISIIKIIIINEAAIKSINFALKTA